MGKRHSGLPFNSIILVEPRFQRSHTGTMECALSFSWRLPNAIKEDYLSGKLNSIFFVSAGI